jgi:hypothetical protein
MKTSYWSSCEKIDIKSLTSESLSNINYINRYIDPKYTGSVSNIASGIGDILINKNNYPNNEVFWNIKHLLDYKPFPDNLKNIRFNIELLLKLFGKENIKIFYNNKVNIKQPSLHKLCFQPNLINHFNISPPTYTFKYIIVHTKLRFPRSSSRTFIRNIKLKLQDFFSNFKSKYTILVLGERKIDVNGCSKAIPTMTTIYDECLLLKNNNDVIDLTEEKMYNTPEMSRFERDIGIIHNAEFNIGIGHGGQFCFNLFFSKKSIYYCPPGLINFEIKNPNIKIITNIENFIHQCEQNMS